MPRKIETALRPHVLRGDQWRQQAAALRCGVRFQKCSARAGMGTGPYNNTFIAMEICTYCQGFPVKPEFRAAVGVPPSKPRVWIASEATRMHTVLEV